MLRSLRRGPFGLRSLPAFASLLACTLLGSSIPDVAQAVTITRTASGSNAPTPISFPPAPGSLVNGDFLIEPNPGCTGPATNCGLTGDGINDQTTWTFDFGLDPDYASFLASGALTSAALSLTLTVKEMQISTDVVRIRGLANITAQIQQLMVGQTEVVRFELLDFYTSSEILDNLNAILIGGILPKDPGQLLMLYQDDAIISNASLVLSTTVIPEPSTSLLMLTGLALLARRRDRSRE